ncbi:MAG: hypothetical protein C3F11_17965 [Methylocystaceae bacterium]|nr:MAG: hypothetical protein C3F11_17965 [Methylocystaceae bacterium]
MIGKSISAIGAGGDFSSATPDIDRFRAYISEKLSPEPVLDRERAPISRATCSRPPNWRHFLFRR